MSHTNQLAGPKLGQFLGQSIARKLYFLLLLIGLLPMIVVAVAMYQSAYTGIEKQSFAQLDAIKTVKAKQVEDYFQCSTSGAAGKPSSTPWNSTATPTFICLPAPSPKRRATWP